MQDFDLLVLVFLVATNVVFLILSYFDPLTFDLLSKKFLVLTLTAVVLNYLLNKAIEGRMKEKNVAVNWREDRLFIKIVSITGALLLLGFFAFTIWYSTPKSINYTYEGLLIEESEAQETVTVEINGELDRSLAGGGSYVGTFQVQGESIDIPEAELDAWVDYRGSSNGGILRYSEDGSIGDSTMPGYIHLENNFQEFVLYLEQGGIIVAPADGEGEALEKISELE